MPKRNRNSISPKLAGIRKNCSQNVQELIKELRYRERLTQTEFARRVGINRSLVCQYESGDREPSLESIIKLALYAKKPVDAILGLEGAPQFNLNRGEEKIINYWRKIPEGAELVIKKTSSHEEDITDSQITIKQEVKI